MLYLLVIVFHACDDIARDMYAMREDDVKVRAHEGDRNNWTNLGGHDQLAEWNSLGWAIEY